MRKITLATTAVLALLASLFSTAPANAVNLTANYPWPVQVEVGEPISFQGLCTSSSTLTYFFDQSIPGLSIDSATGEISGAVNQIGSYLINVWCSEAGGSTLGTPLYLQVIPRNNPYLEVTPLNDSTCSVQVGVYGLPPHYMHSLDATINGVLIRFRPTNPTAYFGSEVYKISYDDVSGATLSDGRAVDVSYYDPSQDIDVPITPEIASAISCGSTVGWSYFTDWRGGINTATKNVAATRGSVVQAPGKPFLKVSALNDADCSFLVEGYVPNTPDPGSVTFKVDQHNGASQNQAVLSSVQAGEPFKLMFSSNDSFDMIEAISGAQIASAVDPQVIQCKTATDFSLGYSSAGTAATSATVTNLKATTGTDLAPIVLGANPRVKAEFTGGTPCTVHLSGYFPYASTGVRNRHLTLTYDEGDGVEVFEPTEVAADGFYQIDYSMNSVSNSTYNFVSSNGGEPTCGQGVTFKASYNFGVDSSAQSANVFVYAGASTPCAAGTYSATGNAPCSQADPGFFVPDTGWQGQMPCMPGTYSANYGSTTCTPAPAGSIAPATGMSLAILCPAGTYSAVTGGTECTSAPLNSYTRTGASFAVVCPLGTHTEATESTSPRDCLPNIVQQINLKALPVGLKFNQALVVNKKSSAGLDLEVSARGNCSVVSASATTWKILGGKVKGICEVLIANRGAQGISEFALSKTLKVSKTGK